MKTKTPKKNKSDLLKSFLQSETDLNPKINEDIFNEKSKRFEAQNLINIYADLKSESNEKILSQFEGKNFSEFKKDFADLLIEYISPISDKIDLLRKNEDHLLKILKDGQEKASNVADKTIKDVKNIIGLSL